eukprot:Rmarinus@m.23991
MLFYLPEMAHEKRKSQILFNAQLSRNGHNSPVCVVADERTNLRRWLLIEHLEGPLRSMQEWVQEDELIMPSSSPPKTAAGHIVDLQIPVLDLTTASLGSRPVQTASAAVNLHPQQSPLVHSQPASVPQSPYRSFIGETSARTDNGLIVTARSTHLGDTAGTAEQPLIIQVPPLPQAAIKHAGSMQSLPSPSLSYATANTSARSTTNQGARSLSSTPQVMTPSNGFQTPPRFGEPSEKIVADPPRPVRLRRHSVAGVSSVPVSSASSNVSSNSLAVPGGMARVRSKSFDVRETNAIPVPAVASHSSESHRVTSPALSFANLPIHEDAAATYDVLPESTRGTVPVHLELPQSLPGSHPTHNQRTHGAARSLTEGVLLRRPVPVSPKPPVPRLRRNTLPGRLPGAHDFSDAPSQGLNSPRVGTRRTFGERRDNLSRDDMGSGGGLAMERPIDPERRVGSRHDAREVDEEDEMDEDGGLLWGSVSLSGAGGARQEVMKELRDETMRGIKRDRRKSSVQVSNQPRSPAPARSVSPLSPTTANVLSPPDVLAVASHGDSEGVSHIFNMRLRSLTTERDELQRSLIVMTRDKEAACQRVVSLQEENESLHRRLEVAQKEARSAMEEVATARAKLARMEAEREDLLEDLKRTEEAVRVLRLKEENANEQIELLRKRVETAETAKSLSLEWNKLQFTADDEAKPRNSLRPTKGTLWMSNLMREGEGGSSATTSNPEEPPPQDDEDEIRALLSHVTGGTCAEITSQSIPKIVRLLAVEVLKSRRELKSTIAEKEKPSEKKRWVAFEAPMWMKVPEVAHVPSMDSDDDSDQSGPNATVTEDRSFFKGGKLVQLDAKDAVSVISKADLILYPLAGIKQLHGEIVALREELVALKSERATDHDASHSESPLRPPSAVNRDTSAISTRSLPTTPLHTIISSSRRADVQGGSRETGWNSARVGGHQRTATQKPSLQSIFEEHAATTSRLRKLQQRVAGFEASERALLQERRHVLLTLHQTRQICDRQTAKIQDLIAMIHPGTAGPLSGLSARISTDVAKSAPYRKHSTEVATKASDATLAALYPLWRDRVYKTSQVKNPPQGDSSRHSVSSIPRWASESPIGADLNAQRFRGSLEDLRVSDIDGVDGDTSVGAVSGSWAILISQEREWEDVCKHLYADLSTAVQLLSSLNTKSDGTLSSGAAWPPGDIHVSGGVFNENHNTHSPESGDFRRLPLSTGSPDGIDHESTSIASAGDHGGCGGDTENRSGGGTGGVQDKGGSGSGGVE